MREGLESLPRGGDNPAARWIAVDPATLSRARAALQAEEYARLASLLQAQQQAAERREAAATAELLMAARQLCLAAGETLAEMGWHEQALGEAAARVDELNRRLDAALQLLGAGNGGATAVAGAAAPAVDDGETQPTRPTLWARVRDFFGLGPLPPLAPLVDALETAVVAPKTAEPALSSAESALLRVLYAEMGAMHPERASDPLAEGYEVSLRVGRETAVFRSEPSKPFPTPSTELRQAIEATMTITAHHKEQWPLTPFPTTQLADGALPTSPAKQAQDDREKEAATQLHSATTQVSTSGPLLVVYCLGPFQVYLNEQPIDTWPGNKGKSVFKYLVTHREHPVAKEILMDLFWPDVDANAARNNLNVAVYGLRQALRAASTDFAHILFQNGAYLLNPAMAVWSDFQQFWFHLQMAKQLEHKQDKPGAIAALHAAVELYQGEFLAEDRYEEWVLAPRQQLLEAYLQALEQLSKTYFEQQQYAVCINLCRQIVTAEPCREDVHRLLMRCYAAQSQRYLALRQYYQCVEALERELDIPPAPETRQLYEKLRRYESI
jgi:DNA-binding SARP family transcriptional activator